MQRSALASGPLIKLAPSTTERLNLSILATSRPAAFPPRMLGHASAAMTLDIYADLFDDDLEAVATALHDARSQENVGTGLRADQSRVCSPGEIEPDK